MISNIQLYFLLALRNVFRNKKRSLLTLLAIAVGFWSSLALAAFSRGINNQMALDAIKNLTGHAKVHLPEYLNDPVVDSLFELPQPDALAFLDTDVVEAWSTRINVPGVIVSERESSGVKLVGIIPEKERGLSFIIDSVTEGRYLSGSNDKGVIVGKKLLETLQTNLGKRIVLMSQGGDGKIADRGFRIAGVFDAELESTEKSYVFLGLSTLQNFLGVPGKVSEIVAVTEDKDKVEGLSGLLRENFTDLKTTVWMTMEPLIVAMTEVQDGFLKIWFFLVVIVIAFGLVNTLFMAIFERTKEIGLFQALGMTPLGIVYQIVFESTILIFLGALLGNCLCFLTLFLTSDGIDLGRFSQGTEMLGIQSVFYPKLVIKDFIEANLIIVLLSLIASLYPAWKASRYLPVEALRKE